MHRAALAAVLLLADLFQCRRLLAVQDGEVEPARASFRAHSTHLRLRRTAKLLGNLVAAEERIGGRQDADAAASIDAEVIERFHDRTREGERVLRRADEGHIVAAEHDGADRQKHLAVVSFFQ